ncbi:MAG TPA: 2'-deoxycytidine 5'-triphosphate deaminase, partial [Tepidiformaceae bacterium]|nr:2'-deoxycytidine 5'-triphosphate deaminase [Tepidiformaceae bacterium]
MASPEPVVATARAEATRVLAYQQLREMVATGVISAPTEIPDAHFQPSSLDLRLGSVAYRLRCSFLPGRERVEDALAAYTMETLDLERGAVLEQNRPYLIPLQEELNLPTGFAARVNPRSSTGRLDIFTRVVTDRSEQFDSVAAAYRGKLYLEVVPRSFTIKVKTGQALCQLRLLDEGVANTLPDAAVIAHHDRTPLLFADRKPLPLDELHLREGLFLSIDLSGRASADGIVGYRARKNSRLLDLAQRDHYPVEDFWEPVRSEGGRIVVLEPEEFYLLYSRERVRIPVSLAAEMVAFDPSAGEVRTHYAGFFDPGFGERSGGLPGAHAVLEVRAHDVPFAIADGQRLCKLAFQELSQLSDRAYGSNIGSRYNENDLILLPRQFQSRTSEQRP